jgi:hypothetical protein
MSVSENSIDNMSREHDWDTKVSIVRHTVPFAQTYKNLFIEILALLMALALFELILAAPLM